MQNTRGFALEATLFTMLLISVLIASAFAGVVTVTRTTNMDYRNSRVSYAAEAGADAIMAQLADMLEDGTLADSELAAISAPTLQGFTFGSIQVTKLGGVAVEAVTDGPFAGLYSLTQRLEIYSQATDGMDNEGAVIVSAKAQAIPIFQFGIFFDADLEITNGPPLDFDGWIHTNGNLYLSSNNAYYHNILTTPNIVVHDRKDQPLVYNGVEIDDAMNTGVVLNFDSRSIPGFNAFKAASDAAFDNRLMTNAYGVDSLRVPLPAGMVPRVVVEPRVAGDPQLVRDAKFAWKSDWYMTVDLAALGTGGNVCGTALIVRDGGEPVPTAAECANIFTWSWDVFVDGREGVFANVLDVDLAQLFAWVAANPAGKSDIMYFTFTNVAGAFDPRTDGIYPVVRLRNGTTLGNPITFSTDRPIYVWGNFNSDVPNWVPAAVVGDAITWLSTVWVDNIPQHTTPGGFVRTNAANTAFYGAVLAGHSATPWDYFVTGTNAPYGGGVENYPRFLESWSGITSTYYGSLVSLYTSQYAALGTWGGGYYSPPARNWHFDMRFENPSDLPPGTPIVGNVIHTAFRPVY